MVILLMGVSGAGRSTIGRLLARKLGWQFYDADELHPPANVEKMRRGIALSDDDRRPWLESVRALVEASLARGESAVVACSALKHAYQKKLVVDPLKVRLVYLKGGRRLIERRMAARTNHFMSKALLASQFETLEEPEDAIVVGVARTPEEIVRQVREELALESN